MANNGRDCAALMKGPCPSCDQDSGFFGHLLLGTLPWLLKITAKMFRVNKMALHLIQQWLNHVAPLCATPRIQVPSPRRRASLQPHKFLEILRLRHIGPISGWKRSSLSMATGHLFLSGMSAWREGRTHMCTPFSHEITYNILARVKCRLFCSAPPVRRGSRQSQLKVHSSIFQSGWRFGKRVGITVY